MITAIGLSSEPKQRPELMYRIYDQYQRQSPYDSADAKRERRSSSVVVFAPRRE